MSSFNRNSEDSRESAALASPVDTSGHHNLVTGHLYSVIIGTVIWYLAKEVEMDLSSKHRGNIALAHALSYFGEKGYYLFLPVGDNGGAIDLAISEDGSRLQRVQCKYTQKRHPGMAQRYPDRTVWQVGMQQVGRGPGNTSISSNYHEDDFDLLFIATPTGDYLIDWKALCQELGHVPWNIVLGGKAEKYRVS